MKYFETHAHFNDEKFDGIVDETLKKCNEAGVDYFINVGYNKESSKKAIDQSVKYKNMYSVIGVHPHDVKTDTANDILDVYLNCENKEKIVGIGEIGLDYAFVKDNKEEQKKLFIDQIDLANKLKLPVIIHTRDASLDTYNILKEYKAEYGVLLHCFNPTEDLVNLVLQRGYMVAFGGNITYKRNKIFPLMLEKIPMEQIVIETDSPYLPPEPLRGTVNTSANLPIICEKLAEYKNMNVEEVAKFCYENAKKFFKIEKRID